MIYFWNWIFLTFNVGDDYNVAKMLGVRYHYMSSEE